MNEHGVRRERGIVLKKVDGNAVIHSSLHVNETLVNSRSRLKRERPLRKNTILRHIYVNCVCQNEKQSSVGILTLTSGSIKPCPFDLQKNLTVPSWMTLWSILPDMETVLVRRVIITSGRRRPSGRAPPGRRGDDIARFRGICGANYLSRIVA